MTRHSKGVVAAGHRLTAEAGAAMLREGGNAVDATIAALAMACVCEPVLASPGGGGFAMLRDGSSGDTTLLDFFPQTPLVRCGDSETGFRHIHADFGATTQRFHIGPATVATPGFFDGIDALSQQGASFSLADLFAPAIAAAADGVEISPYQYYLATVVEPILTATKASRNLFAPDGDLQSAGELFNNPGLSETFRDVAANGWTQTDIPDQILREQSLDGHLTKVDLESYHVEERQPVSLTLGGAKVFLNPLPAASGTLIRHALAHLQNCTPLSLATALNEADQARLSARGDLSVLLDRPIRQQGTTHISAIDADGNACAVTVSNGAGSGEMVGEHGFMLNNILGEEDVNPHGSCDWPLDTRLASMMCPTLIDTSDGGLIALGSGGSSRIRSAVFQTVVRLCLEGQGLAGAIDAPRLHVEDGHLDFEGHFSGDDTRQLTSAFPDHRLWPERNMFYGGVHAVFSDGTGNLAGKGDSRRDGSVAIAQ
ncbi:MAG: gamma-glutamyltransferase [Roseibium sp.]